MADIFYKIFYNLMKGFRFLMTRNFFFWMPDQKFIEFSYWAHLGKRLNLSSPRTFNEKIQWLKLNDRQEIYTLMVDKYKVKSYVADIIGEQYVIPTLGTWKNFEEINFRSLPEQFVLKVTHDSGGIIICRDKSKFNIDKAKKKINHALNRNFYFCCREWPYKNVTPRIIAEPYYENGETGNLADYKVWCFHGEPTYIQYITNRNIGECKEGFYNTDWELQAFSYHNPLMDFTIEKPSCLTEMLEAARKLSNGLFFSRIDFYVLDDHSIRFGEITFYPNSGVDRWKPDNADLEMGRLLLLPIE